MNTSTTSSTALYRIGAVSKTTGIPVSTLRIWETRYGAFTPVKTEGKQRLFAEHDQMLGEEAAMKAARAAADPMDNVAKLPTRPVA